MPRQARVTLPHIAHHVTQRGNYQLSVFESTDDYLTYSRWYNEYSKKYQIHTYAYCLMTNHVHFIVEPSTDTALARVFNTLHMRYAQHLNKRRRVRGHLWQGRFYSCLLDDAHLYRAIRYVERNPVRSGISKKPWEYPWSSASMHTGKDKGLILLKESIKMSNKDWERYLEAGDETFEGEIRLKTQRGMPVAREQFIKKVESLLNRSLTCLNPGRPKKADEEDG